MNVRFLQLLFIALFLPSVVSAQVLAWEFNGAAGNEASSNSNTTDPALNPAVLTRGSGLNVASLGNAFSSTNFTGTTIDAATTDGKFLLVNFTVPAGSTASLSQLSANFRRSGTGPNTFQWQYSTDGTNYTNVGNQISYTGTESNGVAIAPINLAPEAPLQNIMGGTTVTFRLVAWNASAPGGTFALGRLAGNDLAFAGSASAMPACALTASGLGNISCDNNGTPFDTSDDFITFTVDPIGSNIGTTYTVDGLGGPYAGTYGNPLIITLPLGSASLGDQMFTIIDGNDSNCTLGFSVTNPGTCGLLCEINTVTVSNITCDNNGTPFSGADDFIRFDLLVNGVNITSSTYNISASSGAIAPTVGTFGSNTSFSLTPGTAGGGNVNLAVSDSANPGCSSTAVVTDPGNCVQPCIITQIGLANVQCNNNNTPPNPNDDFISFSLNPVSPVGSSTYSVAIPGYTVTPSVGTFGVVTNFNVQMGSAGDGNLNLTITDLGNSACVGTAIITDPGTCDNSCAQFSYSNDTFCQSQGIINVTHTTGQSGIYTFNVISGGPNLSINANTGQINLGLSNPGVYQVNNTVTSSAVGEALTLTGVLDGPLAGGTPKAIELYVSQDIPSLSIYRLRLATNGSATPTANFVLPNVPATAGTYIYVATEVPNFTAYFGFAPTFTNGVANFNGDDVVLLERDNVLIDVFGQLGVDGTGTAWDYLDGWAYRRNNTCPSATFSTSDWIFSGVDATDNQTTNATAPLPWPLGTYNPGTACQAAGNCNAVFSDTITILMTPLVDAGPPSVVCGATQATLTATGMGVWSGGLGTFGNVNQASTTYTPAAGEVGQSVKLFYTNNNPICGLVRDSVIITVIPETADAEFTYGGDVFCPRPGLLTVTHTTGVPGIFTVTEGNPNNVALNPNTGAIDINASVAGTYEITNGVTGCGNMIISGLIDGPLTGGQPKAIEFFVLNDIPDLSLYGFGTPNNGGGSTGIEFTFPATSATRGQYIWVSANNIDFQNYFGFAPDYLGNLATSINGDDAVELYCRNQIIDAFGQPVYPAGSGPTLPWNYEDGWVYRRNDSRITGSQFEIGQWIFSGRDALDNTTTNATAPNPMPVRTFQTTYQGACPSNFFSETITIGDSEAPALICPGDVYAYLGSGECGAFINYLVPSAFDNCPGQITITQLEGPASGGYVAIEDSPVLVVYQATDASGNTSICSFNLFVVPVQNPTRSLVCNDRVNLSLDQNCEVNLNADMILEGGPYACFDDYQISISFVSGQIITAPGTYQVTVTDPITNNRCISTVVVEDKTPPTIDCDCPVGAPKTPECTVKCTDEDLLVGGFLNLAPPTAADNCGNFTVRFTDQIISNGQCADKTLRRTYAVIDQNGQVVSQCQSDYFIEVITIQDIIAPISVVELPCGADLSPAAIAVFFDDPNTRDIPRTNICSISTVERNEGIPYAYPHYLKLGCDNTLHPQAFESTVCNLSVIFNDVLLPGCGPACHGNSKVIRTWTVLDWCTNSITNFVQSIKAVDQEAPTFTLKDTVVSTSPWDCTADFCLPKPWELHDNCDVNVTYTVRALGNGGIMVMPGTGNCDFRAVGAPKGVHLFEYTATDCCGNAARRVIAVSVSDRVAPVAVANQHIVMSLTPDGTGQGNGKLFANSVNNGSWDACSQYNLYFEIRRVDNAPACDNVGNNNHNNNRTFNNRNNNAPYNINDTDFGQFVKFCCEDITTAGTYVDQFGQTQTLAVGEHAVIMRVWDDGNMDGIPGNMGDNWNETWVVVKVESKIPPVIVCPPAAAVTCDWPIETSTTFRPVAGVDFSKTGLPSVFGTCASANLEFRDQFTAIPAGNNCGLGRYTRTFRVIGTTITCEQRIDVGTSESTQQWVITPPPAAPVKGMPCTGPTEAQLRANGPTFVAGPCDVIGVSTTLDSFLFEDGVCKKWRATYNYMNWCTNESRGPFFRDFVYEDLVRPIITECKDTMYSVDGNCQLANLTLTKTATDEGGCTQNGWLKWQVFVDTWADGTIDYEFTSFVAPNTNRIITVNGVPRRQIYVAPTTNGGTVSITLPEVFEGKYSKHKVDWKVSDGCHNEQICREEFTIQDKKAPTPYCVSLSTALMMNGQVELWARDFDRGSFDNCAEQSDLLFTFTSAYPVGGSNVAGVPSPGIVTPAQALTVDHYFDAATGAAIAVFPAPQGSTVPAEYARGKANPGREVHLWRASFKSSAKVFVCDDYTDNVGPNGIAQVPVRMYVHDKGTGLVGAERNNDWCEVTLTLVDNTNSCGGNASPRVAGIVATESNVTVPNVTVNLTSQTETRTHVTDATGSYQFTVPAGLNYDLSASRDDNHGQGVTTLDLVLIQRHILNQSRLSTPYQLIAADVNGSRTITTADMADIRKVVLGVSDRFAATTSWNFVDKAQTFADANNPWLYDSNINLGVLNASSLANDFVAVKMGDVNGSAVSANNNNVEGRSARNLVLVADAATVAAGEVVTLDVRAENFADVYGYQFSANLNGLKVIGVRSGAINVTESNYGMPRANVMTMSWNNETAVTVGSEDVLFTLVLAAEKSGNVSEMMNIGSTVTAAEAYVGSEMTVNGVSMNFRSSGVATAAEYALGQNTPNPFTTETVINYYVPAAAAVKFTITDVTGKVITVRNETAVAGANQLTLNRAEMGSASGVLFYQMESGDFTATKKMIIIE